MDTPAKQGGAMRIKFLTPAKVNLFLRVTGKRPDGYHDIVSLMQPVSLYDEISVGVDFGKGISLKSSGRDVPAGKDNLAWRAAELFLIMAGIKRKKISIDIKKKIPVGGGLAGGSSDAAGVVMALNGLTGAGFGEKKLREILADIGSDCPFFILRSAAIATGRGELLERVKLHPYHYVLVNPGFKISTAWAYDSFHLTKKGKNNILKILKDSIKRPEGIVNILENDLERVVEDRYPLIKELKAVLKSAGAEGVLMSGSGSTVFGLFMERARALKAYSALKKKLQPPMEVFIAKGI